MADELKQAGFEVTPKVGGHGVVGVLKNGPGPTVLVRTDLDGLPVLEETGLPYASKTRTKDDHGREVPTMHACGHDVHMTSFIGTARVLATLRDRWSGTLVFIGQPAEERVGGAKAMLADGLYSRFPRTDYCVALHAASDLPAGTVGYTEGYAMANSDSVDIVVRGVSGHGAWPHTTKDPIILAAQIVLALQTVVSRETSPIEPAWSPSAPFTGAPSTISSRTKSVSSSPSAAIPIPCARPPLRRSNELSAARRSPRGFRKR